MDHPLQHEFTVKNCSGCSAGAGRTGTFIAIDAMLDRVSIEKTVDIFNYVIYLRNSRQSMVRNLVRYEKSI